MAQHPIVVVSTDNHDRSITIMTVDDKRVEYFLGDRYYKLREMLERWIQDEWYNYAVAQLTRAAVSIDVRRPQPLKDYDPDTGIVYFNVGAQTGRISSSHAPWECPFKVLHDQQEEEMSNTDFQNIPSRQYSWTVIAARAQSFHYHQERRWYKTAADAKENAALVIGNSNNDVELCIVQCHDVFKKKPRIELVSTFSKTKSRR